MEFLEFIKTGQIDGVTLYRENEMPVDGTLCVTGHHLILSSRIDNKEKLWLLHKSVDSVEKRLTGSSGILTLKCKDFKIIQLNIPVVEDCLNIASSIEQLSNIDNVHLHYAFFYNPLFETMEDGWHAFRPEMEFGRLTAKDEWRVSNANKNYEVCRSYPGTLIVPKTVDDDTLIAAAAFRQGGRFPVLSYYHKENGMVILRSSQPLTGPNGKRCREDEQLVNAVLGIGKRGYILDTRSVNQTKLSTAKGGGVEPEAHYPQWRKIHQNIERYTTLHDSLIKLIEAADSNTSMDKWLSKLESSNWLSHIKDIVTCACVAAQCIDKEGASVLVHGSEGTDSTLQVTSLAQLILNPNCRTVMGFEALVEREWLQGGHPFGDRCTKSAFATSKNRQEAPVFLLFLDCVWQIWQQFPCSFEFNEDFLMMLFQHSYSSQFGTFLCNNEMERESLNLSKKTVSLWSYVNRPEVLTQYLNPLYEPNSSVIWPSVAPQSLNVWFGLYQRSKKHILAQAELWNEIAEIKNQDKELRSKVIKLRRQLATLEKEALDNNLIPPASSALQDGAKK